MSKKGFTPFNTVEFKASIMKYSGDYDRVVANKQAMKQSSGIEDLRNKPTGSLTQAEFNDLWAGGEYAGD